MLAKFDVLHMLAGLMESCHKPVVNITGWLVVIVALAAPIAGAQTTAQSGSLSSPPEGAARSAAERGATQEHPAPYTTVRWDEDYSYLKDPARRTDYLDPIKYIPLFGREDFYVSVGGQIRDRYEYFNHSAFGAGPQDHDGYNLFRFLPYVDLHVGRT